MRRLLIVSTLLAAAGLLATGIVLAQRSDEPSASLSPLAGQRAETGVVELNGTTLTGDQFNLEQLRGTPVFVNVWASW